MVSIRLFRYKKAFPSKDNYKFVILFVILNNTGSKTEGINILGELLVTDKGYSYKEVSDLEIMNRYNKFREPTETELKEYYCLPLQRWKEIPPREQTANVTFSRLRKIMNLQFSVLMWEWLDEK
jgi:hypothetical protein